MSTNSYKIFKGKDLEALKALQQRYREQGFNLSIAQVIIRAVHNDLKNNNLFKI
jgi:DNA-binding transcriptional MerR regulator